MFRVLKSAIIFTIFLSLFLGYFHTISAITQDLGRHLLSGKIILETNQVPKTNLFSYTFPNFPFINHHWLFEVISYLIFKTFGFYGLLITNTLLILSSFLIIFFYIFKKTNIVSLSLASLLYIYVLFERTDVRPELFSFLFLSIFVTILYSYREKFTKWIFLLVPIELLWVNIHIYFPIGIAVIGLFFIDLLITNRRSLYSKYIGIFGLTFLLSILIAFINPNGLKGALYPLSVFQNYGYSIQENQNIFFLWNYSHNTTILFFAVSIVLLFLSLIFAFKKTYPVDWLISISFSILAITAIRNFPLFVFATFIPFAKSLSVFTNALFESIKRLSFYKTRPKLIKIVILIFMLIALLWQIKNTVETKQIGFGLEKGASQAVDFLQKNNIKGPVFNNFDIGSYLEYRLYPKEKVFIDGRPEAYPTSFFQKIYIPSQKDPNLFKSIDQKYKFNVIFFSHTDQTPWAQSFLQRITNNKDWKMVYLDDYAIILIKGNAANKELIKKFELNQSNLKIANFNLKNINSLIRFSVFFHKIGWSDLEKTTYEDMLFLKPNYCPALYNLSVLLIQKEPAVASIYANRFNYYCK